jgi:hypothetical protein
MKSFFPGQTVYSRKLVSGELRIIGTDTEQQLVMPYFICEALDGSRHSIPKIYLSTKPITETD